MEVEYIAAPPDLATGKSGQPSVAGMRGGAIDIITDANGNFTFGIPKAGWWGFAALDLAGKGSTFNGKHWSQDAVIWVNATDLSPPNADQVAAAGAPGN